MIPYVHWIRFTEYYKLADGIGMRGAVYGFVWSNMKPSPSQYPSDFEECVYIGESGGCYYDKQNGHKGKLRSHLHKRMTSHHKPLTTGIAPVNEEKKYKLFTERYGYGDDVLNGTLTGIPLWVGFICPPKEDPDHCLKSWLISREHYEIYQYQRKFGKSPLMNMEVDGKGKDPDSYSSEVMQNYGILEEEHWYA